MGNCHPSKTNVNRGRAKVNIGFQGVTISHVSSHAVNIYIILWYKEKALMRLDLTKNFKMFLGYDFKGAS
mgnify:CR=1 FL=1